MLDHETNLLIRYCHIDCKIDPRHEWFDLWPSACNSTCASCGIDEIEPIDWIVISDKFEDDLVIIE